MFSSYLLTLTLLIIQVTSCGLHHRQISDAVAQYAPIPSEAASLPLNSDGYAIEAYGKGAYMVTEGSYQGKISLPLW